MILLALLWDQSDESALDTDSDPTARPGDSQRGAPHAEPRKDENPHERLTPLAPGRPGFSRSNSSSIR